jgi:hypothetical protein
MTTTQVEKTDSEGKDDSAHQREARRALRKLAAFLVLLLASFYIAQFMVDLGMRTIRTSFFGASNRMYKGEINAEIIISGSSRALTHYDPRIITARTGMSAFNLGRNGSQTDMQLAYLKAYLARNAKPRLIIHNLDSFSFVTTKEIYDPAQYFPYLDDKHLYQAIARIHPDLAWKLRYVPLYAYAVEDMRLSWTIGVRALLGIQPREDLVSGFQPRHLEWTGDFDAFRKANPEGVKFPIEETGVSILKELIELCRAQDIRLILVYSPVFKGMQDLEIDSETTTARFRMLAEAGGAGFLDYRGLPLCSSQSAFYNSQHLNASGATQFTTILADDLAKRLPALTSSK